MPRRGFRYLAAALDLARIDHPALVGELLERLGSARMRAGHIELAVAAWTEASRGSCRCCCPALPVYVARQRPRSGSAAGSRSRGALSAALDNGETPCS